MATCKMCSRSGWLLMVNGLGLCDGCRARNGGILDSATRTFLSSYRVAENARTAATALSRFKVAREAALVLIPYSDKGIATLTRKPRGLVEEIDEEIERVAAREVEELITVAKEKSGNASTDAARIRPYAAASEKLSKLSRDHPEIPIFADAADKLRLYLDKLRFDLACRKADVEHVKGKPKKAAEIMVEAMMALRHDNTPDGQQADLIEMARTRIRDLGGAVPY